MNGKVRDRIQVPVGIEEERAIELATSSDRAREFTEGHAVRRVIFVPNKLVNIVVG